MCFCSKQKGSASTEFAVIASILITGVLSIPVLGKLGDVNQAAVQATRYVVWEKTIDGDESTASQKDEVTRRFFAHPDSRIKTEYDTDEGMVENIFWKSVSKTSGKAKSLIHEGTAIDLTVENKEIPGGTGASVLASSISAVGEAMEGIIPDADWDLEDKGFYVATISTEIASNSLVSDGVNCSGIASDKAVSCLKSKGAIFVDEWNAQSSGEVEDRVRALAPGGVFSSVGDALSLIGHVPMFEELRDLKGAFGHVDADILPPDRHGEIDK